MNKIHGYYKVQNLEFQSKIEACIYATTTNQDVEWIFNDIEFKNFNWEIEPNQTLDQLYDQRAKELREQYDYIILSYSAGADSHNIFTSFQRQNLLIDELFVHHLDKINSKHTVLNFNKTNAENYNAEHYLQTLPRLKEIQKNNPNQKITIEDMSDSLIKTLTEQKDGIWVSTKKEILNPYGATRWDLKNIKSIKEKFEEGKSVAIIMGIDKPVTYVDSNTNDFYIRFQDRAANMPVKDHLQEYQNVNVEFFYWHPSCLKLLCKQAHTVKKWLEKNKLYLPHWTKGVMTQESYRLIHERVLRDILYTSWNSFWFQVDKPTKEWNSQFASNFFKDYQDTNLMGNYKDGLNYVANKASKYIVKSQNVPDSLKVFGKNYKIGKLNV